VRQDRSEKGGKKAKKGVYCKINAVMPAYLILKGEEDHEGKVCAQG
jgi:hypothetical protein